MRRRRPRIGAPTAADLAALAELTAAAGKVAAAPLGGCGRLNRAAKAAGKALLPAAQRRRDSDLVKLIALGKLWLRLSDADRAERAPELAQLAEAGAKALEPPPAPPPRADIFG